MKLVTTCCWLVLLPVAAQAQLSERIDRYLAPLVRNQDFAGVILVSRNDSVLHWKGYGYADLQWRQSNDRTTIFHIASLTKQFTAAALLVVEQKELLSLDHPLSNYLPDFPRSDEIRLWQLLCHRSGISDYNELEGYAEMSLRAVALGEVIEWFRQEPLLFPPGTDFAYSNANYILAARVLEIASGLDYDTFLQKHIFDPLGMEQTGNFSYTEIVPQRATGYDPAPEGLMRAPYYNKSFKLGSGSLYSSAGDLYKWDRALYTDRILTEASRQKLFTDYGQEYGLGWGVYEREGTGRFAAHDGKSPGFFAYLKRYMEKDRITILILSNINSGIMNHMKADLTDLVFGRDFPIYDTYEALSPPEDLKALSGRYDFPPRFHFTLVEQKGALYFRWMDTPFLQYLTPIGEDRFLMRSRYDKLNFQRTDEGEIAGVNYIQRSDTTFCPRLPSETERE